MLRMFIVSGGAGRGQGVERVSPDPEPLALTYDTCGIRENPASVTRVWGNNN